jgi:hypothetical protein
MSNDQQEAIAAGYNVPLLSLVTWASITPTGDSMPLTAPESIPHFNPGLVKFDGDGLIRTLGYGKVTWMQLLTYLGWSYLSTTYCNGGLTGKVTIYTPLGGLTYHRMNAIMKLPKPADMQAKNWYGKAPIDFTRLAPSS